MKKAGNPDGADGPAQRIVQAEDEARRMADHLRTADKWAEELRAQMDGMEQAASGFAARIEQMSPHASDVIKRRLLVALRDILNSPVVRADPQALAEVMAIRDALTQLSKAEMRKPGAVLTALAKPGQVQAGKESGGRNARTNAAKVLAALAAQYLNHPGQWASFARFVDDAAEKSGYAPATVRERLKREFGLPRR